MTIMIIFVVGYTLGGISALLLIGLALAGREREAAPRRRAIRHDA